MRQPEHAFVQVLPQLLTKARADRLARSDLIGILRDPLALEEEGLISDVCIDFWTSAYQAIDD